jgi:hypothetical protein
MIIIPEKAADHGKAAGEVKTELPENIDSSVVSAVLLPLAEVGGHSGCGLKVRPSTYLCINLVASESA